MIIYRFEKNGLGPYIQWSGPLTRGRKNTRTTKKYNNLLEQILMSSTTERFNNHAKAHEKKKYMYGCPSKQHLRAYFGGNFKSLFEGGFRIKRYKVPDEEVIDMGIEVAFPVKYHKLRTVNNIKKQMEKVR